MCTKENTIDAFTREKLFGTSLLIVVHSIISSHMPKETLSLKMNGVPESASDDDEVLQRSLLSTWRFHVRVDASAVCWSYVVFVTCVRIVFTDRP